MRPIGTLRCLVPPFVVAKGSVPSIIRRCRTWNLGSCLSIVPLQIGTLHCLAPFFVVVKVSVRSIIKGDLGHRTQTFNYRSRHCKCTGNPGSTRSYCLNPDRRDWSVLFRLPAFSS